MEKFTQLFNVQLFDETRSLFESAQDGSDAKYIGALWFFQPLSGMDRRTVDIISSGLGSVLPAGSYLQIGQYASNDVEDEIYSYIGNKLGSTGISREIVERQAHLLQMGVEDPLVGVSGVKLHAKRCFMSLKVPVKDFNDIERDKTSALAAQFEQIFVSATIPFRRANHRDYLQLSRYLMHIYDAKDSRHEEYAPLSEQLMYPGDAVHVDKRNLFFETGDGAENNFYAKALSVKRFPTEVNLSQMNRFVGDIRGLTNQITEPYYFCLTIHYPNQEDKRASVQTKAAVINNQSVGPMGRIPGIQMKKYDFDVLNHDLESASGLLVEANFTAWFFGRNLDGVSRQVESMRTYWTSIGFDFKEDGYILDTLWANSFPLNSHKEISKGLMRYFTLTSAMALQFMPIFGDAIGSKSPVIPLLTRRGEFAGFDLFESQTNYNALIAAASGSGKSFLTQHLVSNYNAAGVQQWVIDMGESYKKLALSMGSRAVYLEFHPDDHETCLNPHSAFLEENGGLEKNFDNALAGLLSLYERMACVEDPLSDTEMAYLEEAIKSQFKSKGGRTNPTDIQNYLHETGSKNDCNIRKTLAIRLEAFSEQGAYGHWVNGKCNVNLEDKDLVVLELGFLKDQPRLQQVILTILMQSITSSMYKNTGRKKILWVDEAWQMMRNPIMVKNLDVGYRTARKYDGAMVVITQNISDLGLNEYTTSMATNAAWKIVLSQEAAEVDKAFDRGDLALEPFARDQMKTIHTSRGKYSEMMIVNGSNWTIYRLVLNRFTQIMYSTSGKERFEILDAIERGEDVVTAIKKFMVGEKSYNLYLDMKQQVDEIIRNTGNRPEMIKMLRELAL